MVYSVYRYILIHTYAYTKLLIILLALMIALILIILAAHYVSLHLVCLFDAKVIKSKFPNNNNPSKYFYKYIHYTCIDFLANSSNNTPLITPIENNNTNLNTYISLIKNNESLLNSINTDIKSLTNNISEYSKSSPSYSDVTNHQLLSKSISKEITISINIRKCFIVYGIKEDGLLDSLLNDLNINIDNINKISISSDSIL